MVLAQRSITPSSFDNNWRRNTPNIPFFPMQESTNKYLSRGIAYFDGDNQTSENEYMSNSLWLPYVISPEKLLELEEYRGFSFAERGEITVSYNKDDTDFLYNFKFVCLNKQEHNDYYPDPYLIICFELELEGSGNSKDEALNDLYQLLDVYFNRTQEICENPVEYKNVINNNIYQQSPWKQSFARTYARAQKLELITTNYQYHIKGI